MPNFEKMIGNILETAKSVFDLEGIVQIIVIIGAIVGALSFFRRHIWKYLKRWNQKKELHELISKWHEALLNIQIQTSALRYSETQQVLTRMDA